MKLNQNAYGWATGVVFALWLFFIALFAMGGTWGVGLMNTCASIFSGYAATWGGAFIGLIWGFILGYISGYVFAWVHNYVTARK